MEFNRQKNPTDNYKITEKWRVIGILRYVTLSINTSLFPDLV